MSNYFEEAFSEILSAIKRLTIKIGTAIRIEQQKVPADPSILTVHYYHTIIRNKINQLSSRAAIMSIKTDQYCLIKVYGSLLIMVDRALRESNPKSKYVQLKFLHRMIEEFENSSTFSYWKDHVILGDRAIKETDG
jgi:hypothetical protein